MKVTSEKVEPNLPPYAHKVERGLDPWHEDAFPGDKKNAARRTGERLSGWFYIDGSDNQVGFIADGTIEPETKEEEDYLHKLRDHTNEVAGLLGSIQFKLVARSVMHDCTKYHEPEASIFSEYGPKLSDVPYMSDKYKEYMKEMDVATVHHYEHNRHHPQYFADGISGMTLIDVLEMICDWKAASKRGNSGSLQESIEKSCERFKVEPQLKAIIFNTINMFVSERK